MSSIINTRFKEVPVNYSGRKQKAKTEGKKTVRKSKPCAHSEASTSSICTNFETFDSVPVTSSHTVQKRKQTNSIHLNKNYDFTDSDLKRALRLYKDSPSYQDLKKKRFKKSFLFDHHYESFDRESSPEIEIPEYKDGPYVKLPKRISKDLPEVPGTKYVDLVVSALPNMFSSEDEQQFKEIAAKKVKKRGRKKAVGYNGKPLSDSCLDFNWEEYLKTDKKFKMKVEHPVMKSPSSQMLSRCVEAGKEITPELTALIEKMHNREVSAAATSAVSSVHQVSLATTKVALLPGEVPLNNLILRVVLKKIE